MSMVSSAVSPLSAPALAIAENGVPAGVLMLLVVLVANLLIENLVDPHVTGRTLRIHPLVVLLVLEVALVPVARVVRGARGRAGEGDAHRLGAALPGHRLLQR